MALKVVLLSLLLVAALCRAAPQVPVTIVNPPGTIAVVPAAPAPVGALANVAAGLGQAAGAVVGSIANVGETIKENAKQGFENAAENGIAVVSPVGTVPATVVINQ